MLDNQPIVYDPFDSFVKVFLTIIQLFSFTLSVWLRVINLILYPLVGLS
jgi:hypothetical protein